MSTEQTEVLELLDRALERDRRIDDQDLGTPGGDFQQWGSDFNHEREREWERDRENRDRDRGRGLLPVAKICSFQIIFFSDS